MPSPLQRTFKDLEAIQVIKLNMERIDRLKEDFSKESNKFRSDERFLNEAETEMEQLRIEEQALIEEMRQIHNDINQLETARKNAEEEKRRSFNNAKRLLTEIKQLKLETNEFCRDVQCESLPESIVDSEDEMKFHCPTNRHPSYIPIGHHNAWALTANASLPYSSPILEALQRQNPAPILTCDDWSVPGVNDGNNNDLMPSPSTNRIIPSSTNQIVSGSTYVASNSKQQPPMKTCGSCQREIHRNAPICPICKAKSKSKHPKKPSWRKNSKMP